MIEKNEKQLKKLKKSYNLAKPIKKVKLIDKIIKKGILISFFWCTRVRFKQKKSNTKRFQK